MRSPRLFALFATVGAAVGGCFGGDARDDLPDGGTQPLDAGLPPTRDVDILFVIDNSATMAEEQTALATSFPQFMNVLQAIEGGLPNVHIGVISSNVGAGGQAIPACVGDGDNGRLQATPRVAGCTPPSGSYIEDTGNGTSKNYTGTLADTFACIAPLGTGGCGFEQHLESMLRALDGRNPGNAGFLRENAFLAVIVIADEDDCSATSGTVFDPTQDSISDPLGPLTSFRCSEFGILCGGQPIGRDARQLDPAGGELLCTPQGAMTAPGDAYLWHPQRYVDFLGTLKPRDPGRLLVATVVGNPDPVAVELDVEGDPALSASCTSGVGSAFPGVRFKYFTDQFPGRSAFASICSGDLSVALVEIAQLLAQNIAPP